MTATVEPPDGTASSPVLYEPVAQEPVVQEQVAQEPVAQEPVVQEPVAQEEGLLEAEGGTSSQHLHLPLSLLLPLLLPPL